MQSGCWKILASRHLPCGRSWRPGKRALAASCLRLNGVVAPRGTQASGAPQARRAPSAFLENVDQREIVETPALRGHLAWPWGSGAFLDLLALLGSLGSLVSLGSPARLGVWGRLEDLERGENGERKENVENRAETAFLASLDPPDPQAPRWLRTSQVLGSLENKDPLDSKALRGIQAVMATEAPKETGVSRASRATGESLDRGVRTAAQVCQESVAWLGPRGSRVCKVHGGPQAQRAAMETLDHLGPRVLLALRDPRDLLA